MHFTMASYTYYIYLISDSKIPHGIEVQYHFGMVRMQKHSTSVELSTQFTIMMKA